MSATSMPACEANRKASKIESPGTNGTTMPIVARRPRSSAATGIGQQRRRPLERRPERRRQLQRDDGRARRGELLVDDPAEDGVVVIRRQPGQVAERLDERRLGVGAAAQATASSSTCAAARASGVSTPLCFSFCAYCASESMSRVLSCRPCLTRFLRSAKTSASS